ncbi:D-alanyl-D-alanine carboxypeptidase family protein [Beijerinckia sp. L45]|uniref:D-alanyl-D-alanine carboxypeptidase family protein n=1 Tax=Beijerinckia sp. L45 TaxID=1641855 RepID=UPI00131B008B|nr:D-alanyl-D-alanine carboxypeptidase family protein [Beijerinckia sp. L45]
MRRISDVRTRLLSLTLATATLVTATVSAGATPALVMDVTTGDVLYQNQATQPWYPASLTKLMTVYVALNAVRAHRISLDTPLVVSARAAAMPPSHMGFAPGTQVTLGNALKMLMVKSANDLAITVAEGISGSVEAFAEDMNEQAATLGLHESHFVNPNGLPAAGHVSSARDMALIARALYLTFPEEAPLFNLGALELGTEIIVNHNNLLGRYPGVDGMKTGFTCSAGFNVVASAYKDGRRLVTVIMGAPTVAARTAKAAALFDRGFAGIDRPIASIVALPASAASEPPDMRDQVCRNRARLITAFNSEIEQLDAPLMAASPPGLTPPGGAFMFNSASATPRPMVMATVINSIHPAAFEPVPVHVGAEPGYAGLVAQARPPHSPIGTEPDPTAAIAYAPPLTATGLVGMPLGVDATALPLKGRGRMMKASRPQKARTLKASAEAPVTKVMDEDRADKPGAKKAAAPATGVKHARAEAAGDTDDDSKASKTKTALPPKRPVAKAATKSKAATAKPVASKAKDSATE